MLSDPVVLLPDLTSADDSTVSLPRTSYDPIGVFRLSTSTPGESLQLTISHSESKENPGVVTDRHLIRLDHVIPDEDEKAIKASCYVVISEPRGTVTTTQSVDLFLRLLSLIMGMQDEGDTWDTTDANLANYQGRVTAFLSRMRNKER